MFVEEKRFTYSSVLPSSAYFSLARSLARSFSLFFSSLILQSRIRILELRTRSHSLNVEGSQFHIYLLYSISLYGKSIKDYWFSFCICACLSSFLLESLLSIVSALLVRCGSALLINLILVMRFLAMLL